MQQQSDRWLGFDKVQHFWMSFAATSFAFAGATAGGADADLALGISVPVALGVGVGKEVLDRRQGGFFSPRDLTADVLGVAAAWLLLRQVR